ncbi:MAG: DUF932 domain-containing protein [Pirellulales bacterium]|nr:DUF932 domain-containing protein [Pirellulales bacterium]
MTHLTRASAQLFVRSEDECFESLSELLNHCRWQQAESIDLWQPPAVLRPINQHGRLMLSAGSDGAFALNDWSFSQLCGLARVSKETVNRLSVDTAQVVFGETLPSGNKPVQLLTEGDRLRSIHGSSYTRLHNAELLTMLSEFAVDFQPPQRAATGHTGLYCGEQDLFCFLIDPLGWTEIDGEAFAPGFFVWNSEVGRRSVGVQTFWFQAVCANHIVWDAVEVVEFARKHTGNVHESLVEIRRIVEGLVAKRDERRDGFYGVVRKAMQTALGDDADEVLQVLSKAGVNRALAAKALEIARQKGRFTVFAVVDALTRLAGELKFAGDRTEADQRAGRLLELVT